MSDIWIVLVEDRHADVEALPFSTEQAAIEAARAEAEENARSPEDVTEEPLTPAMTADGWVLYLPYGTEGDCVRVVKRTLDGAITCRTVIPASHWDDPRRREAMWGELRVRCEQEAVAHEVTFSGEPEERVSQYIRFFWENGDLKCDLGATEWTATDVWLQLTIRTEQ
jgi:hypothetical protein